MKSAKPFDRCAWLLWLFIAMLLASCSAASLFSGEISVSPEQLTKKLAERFPLEKSVGGLLDATLTQPRVELNPAENRLVATVDVTVKLALSNKAVSGVLTLSGRPEYVAASRSLFLRDARVDRIRMDKMPDALSASLAKAATNLAKDALENKPIHTFKPEDFVKFGIRYEPERIEVRADALVLKVK